MLKVTDTPIRYDRTFGHELFHRKVNGEQLYSYLAVGDVFHFVNRAEPRDGMPLFVTYHTHDRRYMALTEKLARAALAAGIELAVCDIGEPDKRWIHNIQWKPSTLLRVREARPGRPLVWIDADAELHRTPWIAAHIDADIGIVRTDRFRDWANFVYFADTPAANFVLALWAEASLTHPHVWDETIFTWAWHTAYCRLDAISTMFLPSTGLGSHGNGRHGIITQGNASRGYHDFKYERNFRHWTTAFKRAVLMNDFTREFTLGETFK